MRILIGIIGILVGSAVAAAEDYYVWVDEDGVTNYSERNPHGQSAQHVTRGSQFEQTVNDRASRRPGAVETPTESEEGTEETASTEVGDEGSDSSAQTQELDPDVIAKEREALQAKINKTKRANCEIGKTNLAKLEAYSRIRVKDEGGEERILGEDERQAKMEEARQIIRDNCTG